MIGWLGKIVNGILTFIKIEAGIQAYLPNGVQQPVSTVTDDLSRIIDAVQNGSAVVAALKAPNTTPEQEAAAIAPLIGQELLDAEFMLNKKIADQAGFQTGCSNLVTAIQQILKSIEAK